MLCTDIKNVYLANTRIKKPFWKQVLFCVGQYVKTIDLQHNRLYVYF